MKFPTFFALLAAPLVATAGTYDLEPDEGRLYVVVRGERGGLLGSLAHDHVVVATSYSGSVTWDPEHPETCSVRIDLPIEALSVDPGNARSWAGFTGETSDRDKEKIRENFSGDDQLEASRFPTIRYQSTSCTPHGDTVQVAGDLTIHGVSKRVSLPMHMDTSNGRLRASGNVELTHADFGMTPYRALAGALRNQDRLSFVVDVSGALRGPASVAGVQ